MRFLFAIARFVLPILVVFFLSACGFHLRGSGSIPNWLDNVTIISENNDKQFVSILQSRLEGTKAQINPDPALAQYWIIINEVSLSQQIMSVGSSTNPRQYTLTLVVDFIVKTHKGQVVKASGKISVSRDLILNNNRILGSKDEEHIIIGEMKQDAVTQMMSQLSHPHNQLP